MSDNGRQKEILKWMLGQYNRAKRRKKQLNERLMRINEERESPLGAVGYDPLPRSSGAGNGNGAASIMFKLADLEERIYAQKAECDRCMVRVSEILEYLPEKSIELEICELRYIDDKTWPEIEAGIPMAKSKCIDHHNKAMDILLQYPRVRKMCKDNEQEFINYSVERYNAKRRRQKAKKESGGMKSGNQNGGTHSGNGNRKAKHRR